MLWAAPWLALSASLLTHSPFTPCCTVRSPPAGQQLPAGWEWLPDPEVSLFAASNLPRLDMNFHFAPAATLDSGGWGACHSWRGTAGGVCMQWGSHQNGDTQAVAQLLHCAQAGPLCAWAAQMRRDPLLAQAGPLRRTACQRRQRYQCLALPPAGHFNLIWTPPASRRHGFAVLTASEKGKHMPLVKQRCVTAMTLEPCSTGAGREGWLLSPLSDLLTHARLHEARADECLEGARSTGAMCSSTYGRTAAPLSHGRTAAPLDGSCLPCAGSSQAVCRLILMPGRACT